MNENHNDGSQLICTKNDNVRRKRSLSGPPPEVLRKLEDRNDNEKTNVIQINKINNNNSSQLDSSIQSNVSSESTDSNELNQKSNQFLNYIFNNNGGNRIRFMSGDTNQNSNNNVCRYAYIQFICIQ
jgi:hypothetical protein